MEKSISAADANRNFSMVLREVRNGHSYVVTTHGKPVAKILPLTHSGSSFGCAALVVRLRAQPHGEIGTWCREDLYEDAR